MMKVSDVMTKFVVCCTPETNIGAAVDLLWRHNCGMLPVIDDERKLVGVITDRDICIALGTRNRLAGDMKVREVASQKVLTCLADDEIHSAMSIMAEYRVRRLPVVSTQGVPVGILSMDDILTHADIKRREGGCELYSDEIARSLKQVWAKPDFRSHAR